MMYTSYGDLKPYAASEALLLLNESRGDAYFIPEGYEPILIKQEDLTAEIRTEIRRATAHLRIPRALHECRLPSYIVTTRKTNYRFTDDTDSALLHERNPPRPPNAFILYRKAKQAEVSLQNAGISNNDVSRIIGHMWKNEMCSVKEHYQQAAEIIKCQHRSMYPDYRYRPRKTEPARTQLPQASRITRKALLEFEISSAPTVGSALSLSKGKMNYPATNAFPIHASTESMCCDAIVNVMKDLSPM